MAQFLATQAQKKTNWILWLIVAIIVIIIIIVVIGLIGKGIAKLRQQLGI